MDNPMIDLDELFVRGRHKVKGWDVDVRSFHYRPPNITLEAPALYVPTERLYLAEIPGYRLDSNGVGINDVLIIGSYSVMKRLIMNTSSHVEEIARGGARLWPEDLLLDSVMRALSCAELFTGVPQVLRISVPRPLALCFHRVPGQCSGDTQHCHYAGEALAKPREQRWPIDIEKL
jgi:hypothetical protein